jgi:hypothetical protein
MRSRAPRSGQTLTLQTECTAKAVEGRLYGWKKKNVDAGASSTPVKKTATPKKPVTPKTPASRPRASAKKFTKEPTPASETSSDVEAFTESPTAERNKRVRSTPKRTYVESEAEGADDEGEDEYVPFNKRFKTEPVNDEVLQSYEMKAEV